MTCDEASELLAAYALDALEGQESGDLEEHLEGCPACRLALEQDHEIVRQMAAAVDLADPPAELKGRLLARLDAYEAERHAPVDAVPASSPRRAPRRSGGTRSAPVQHTERWSSGSRWRAAFVGVAAITFALLGWTIHQGFQVNDMQGENTRLAADMRRQMDALSFVSSPRVQAVKLVGSDTAPQAKGTVFVDPEENKALIMASNLPEAPEGEVFKLWMWRTDRSRVELATFRRAPNGYFMGPIQPAETLNNHLIWRLTLQKAGDKDLPAGQRILDGRMPPTPGAASAANFPS